MKKKKKVETREPSEAARKDALIKDAKEKMAALEDPVQPDDAWTDVVKKMRKAGWDTRVPAPLVGGLPIGGANFVFLLPSGKRPKKGGEGGLDYLVNTNAAQEFAKEHFGWLGPPKTLEIEAADEWLTVSDKLKRNGWSYKKPSGFDTDWRYFAPGRSKVKNPVEGEDYFKGDEALKNFCRTAYGWDPKGAQKIRLLRQAQEEEEEE